MTSAADKLYSLKMSDTPKTDAESNHIQNVYNDWICRKDLLIDADKGVVDEQFARQLEKELNAAYKYIDELKNASTYAIHTLQPKDPYGLNFLQSDGLWRWKAIKNKGL